MNNILKKLLTKSKLDSDEIEKALEIAMRGENPIQVAAFLVLLEAKGVTSDELFYVLHFLEGKGKQLKTSFPVLDIVGTGGDNSNTFNISTGSSFLAAACGVKVAKHGNRSVSSNCGSMDVLEALGVELNLRPEDFAKCLEETGICFMPAFVFHSTWQALKDLRKKLGVRTLLNLVGPLLNPAKAKYQLVGVFKEELLGLVAGALQKQGKKAMVVCSNHIDELTPLGPASVRLVDEKGVRTKHIDPLDYGIKRCQLKDIQGKDVIYNAERLKNVLKGEEGPWAETLILNAAAGLWIAKKVPTLQQGVDLARKQHQLGGAYQKLKECINYTKQLKECVR